MPGLVSVHKKAAKAPSGRKHVNQRIFRFSMLIAVAGALLTLSAYIAASYPFFLEEREVNLHTLSEIECTDTGCDTSRFWTDWQSDPPDYLVDTQARFFYYVGTPTATSPGRFAPLDYSDATFIARFRQPDWYKTPDGEVWRLYSRSAPTAGNRRLEVIVGYAVKSPSKEIETPSSLIGVVDATLRREADEIASRRSAPKAAWSSRNGFSAGGFQVVDPSTGQVVEQGGRFPPSCRIIWPCRVQVSSFTAMRETCT